MTGTKHVSSVEPFSLFKEPRLGHRGVPRETRAGKSFSSLLPNTENATGFKIRRECAIHCFDLSRDTVAQKSKSNPFSSVQGRLGGGHHEGAEGSAHRPSDGILGVTDRLLFKTGTGQNTPKGDPAHGGGPGT